MIKKIKESNYDWYVKFEKLTDGSKVWNLYSQNFPDTALYAIDEESAYKLLEALNKYSV